MAEMMTPNGLVVGLIAKPATKEPEAAKAESVKPSASKAKPAAKAAKA
jgi:hypothetical protein